MAASEKTLTADDCTLNGGETKKKNSNKVEILTETPEPWAPTDLQFDPCREKALLERMESCINKVESSLFYHHFRDQLLTPPISNHLLRVLGSELKMQMVIYGIGSLEMSELSRLQLSLAILIRKDFRWIGDIEVFDPILSATEYRILEALGCVVLSVNEHGRKQALKPTIFFMPHCDILLYNNLLQANWKQSLLNNTVIFGNSFDGYMILLEFSKNIHRLMYKMGHILAAREFTNDFGIKTISDDYHSAFRNLSWHFFSPLTETKLQSMNEFLMKITRQAYD